MIDIASGTGLAAEAAAAVVGPRGRVLATDVSPPMLQQAQARLGELANVSCAVEDAQSLTLADESFDAVICNMGLMYFPDPARSLSEFRRVLRPGGRAAVSVYASPATFRLTPGRGLVGGVLGAIARQVPAKTAEIDSFFTFGRDRQINALFEDARFQEVET
ncbi:MAG TPA: class I SAM-dependent methyltransferase, partial [Acetobacteraceae bacterium]|nr:class I SAM-dependent methyltransferase [Acetobacteraceae bacterium]